MIPIEYVGYTVLALFSLGYLISLLPVRKDKDKDE